MPMHRAAFRGSREYEHPSVFFPSTDKRTAPDRPFRRVVSNRTSASHRQARIASQSKHLAYLIIDTEPS